jgi:hypothetical protein
MKSFKQYLKESEAIYTFRIKAARELTDDELTKIENHLAKYDVQTFSSPKKLMLQTTPYDFPQLRGYEIYVIEFSTSLPASAYQIQTEITNLIPITDGHLKVRSDNEPLEKREQEILNAVDSEIGSLLGDPTYGEADDVNGEDYYGDKYNTTFVQELLKMRKNSEPQQVPEIMNEADDAHPED